MKAIIALIVLGLAVCCTAKLFCPASLDAEKRTANEAIEKDEKDDIGIRVSLDMSKVKEVCTKMVGLPGDAFDYMSSKSEVARPTSGIFDGFTDKPCKKDWYYLKKIWHTPPGQNGEMCHIIYPKVWTVRCYFEQCDCDNIFKRCRPAGHVWYNILVYCPSSQTCQYVRRRYPTDCCCKRWNWWCLRQNPSQIQSYLQA